MLDLKTHFTTQNAKLASVAILAMVAAFCIGIQTSENVHTLDHTSAYGATVPGDMNGDQTLTILDAQLALEISLGYIDANSSQRLNDPNQDGNITAQDVLDILHLIR